MSGFLADLGLALRIGLRDLRGAGRSFVVLLGALMLGVAIIAAVGILNQGVQTALERDARLLLGGDLELEQANAPVPAADLERIVPPGGSLSAQVRLSTLAAADDRTVAVSLKAVDDAYPLLGEVGLDPPMPLAEALANGGGVAEPALLARLGLAVGDSVKVGETSIQIRAVLLREPDRVGGLFSLGPRLLVGRATLDAAQVLLPGALARYEYKVTLPEGTDAALFAADLQRSWPDAGWRARSPRDVQPQITRVTDRLATFLTLAGLTALLSGGLGIALTIETHLARRTGTIATLKSLGASGGQVFTIYLAQVMLLAVAGVVLGLALGLLLPLAVRLVPDGVLPIAPDLGVYAGPLLRAALAGLLTTFVFAVWPLGDRARGVAGPLVSGAGHARAPLAAPALSGDDGRGRAGAGRGRDPGRPAARDRRLVRAHRGRGRTPALGHHPPVAARRQPAAASRRLRPAPRDRQPASAGLALAARDRGAGCGRHAAGGGGGARQQPQQRGGSCACRPARRRST